jgi:phage shock protein C
VSRRLYRSRTDSVLGGVAGGVAEYLDADPAIVRIIWAILAIVTGGIFLVLYVVMWIVVPEEPEVVGSAAPPAEPGTTPAASAAVTKPPRRERGGSGGGAMIFGLILVGLGAYFLIDEYLPQVDVNALWPIALVVLGLALLINSLRGRAAK